MSKIVQYRQAAEECRRRAAQTPDPILKDALQRKADNWGRLAHIDLMNPQSRAETPIASKQVETPLKCEPPSPSG